MSKVAIYPGSFDPVTMGHLNIIKRANNVFDKVIVAVFNNPNKQPVFSIEERVEMLQETMQNYDDIEIDDFSGLLVDYFNQKEADVVVRGLRVVSDFENELQRAAVNKKLDSKIETMFLMTKSEYVYVSSSAVKEVAKFGGSIEGLVPDHIVDRVLDRLDETNKNI